MLREDTVDRLLVEVEQAREELVDFVTELVRIPTVNPPGEAYQVAVPEKKLGRYST